MKKILIVIQMVIIVLVIAKALTLAGVIKKSDIIPATSLITNHALAEQPKGLQPSAASSAISGAKPVPPAREPDHDNLSEQRDLAKALSAKKIELDNRENTLRAEEQRLLSLRKEITDKIAVLKSNEEKLSAILDSAHNSEVKRYKEMAKVYEATPPAKAGSMMEKLDIKTAAGITMNMKKDKAGAIWGYINPQRAVEITKEITRVGGKTQAD